MQKPYYRGVYATRELKRVAALPRREVPQEIPEGFQETFRKLYGTDQCSMDLWLTQADGLMQLAEVGGLFGMIGVGRGKALLSLLAATVTKAERPLLLLPAALRDQTLLKVIPELSQHWQIPEQLEILGYEELSLIKNKNRIAEISPDLIVADEAHYLKNLRSGRGKRVRRWMEANPETRFVALSGTIFNGSILDYAHLIRWSLKEYGPLPNSYNDLMDWAAALDEKAECPLMPGALRLLSTDDALPAKVDQVTARKLYRDRLLQTPGVVASGAKQLGVSLQILERKLSVPESVTAALKKLTDAWETPDGREVQQAVEIWSKARQISCGFFYYFDPKPPRPWLIARSAWNEYYTETLKRNRRQLDTEKQVWLECSETHEGHPKGPDHCAWCSWELLKDSYEGTQRAQWIDPFMVEDICVWLEETQGIAWIDHREMGYAVEKASGHRYFFEGAKASRDILFHEGPLVASYRAHGTGKNLQDRYHQNLITCPFTRSKTWEQVLGRTHREGQQADTVTAQVYRHTEAFRKAIEEAKSNAKFVLDTSGERGKLLYADFDF